MRGPRRGPLRGYSSTGRAPALQAGGCGFEPRYLHQIREKVPSHARRPAGGRGAAKPDRSSASSRAVRYPRRSGARDAGASRPIFDNRIRDVG